MLSNRSYSWRNVWLKFWNRIDGDFLQYLDDKDMEELANRVIGKLQNMADEEFTITRIYL